MAQKFTLQPLLDLVRDRTDEATRRLGQLMRAEQNAQKRLDLLAQYRAEYVQKFRDAQSEGLTLQALRNYQEFIDRIDLAICQQTAQVETAAQNTAAGQEDWKTQNTKLKALDTLAARQKAVYLKKEAKQEQKQQDEFAGRQFQQGRKTES
ncbi:MAG: flagellar export protein FliJ [Zoogloeaceae bacterium]|jgi:flagellar FliJ protein|nr:flagellar export protein FliJ [Zoogloeaceae bacterium]